MNAFKKYWLIISLLVSWQAVAQQFPTGFINREVAANLDPTDLVVTPDQRVLITIKSGKILVVENDALTSSVMLNIENQVDNFNERGLGHLVLDPDFELNNYYYVYYTEKNSNRNRVSRFTANGNSTLPGSEVVLLQLEPMAGSIHNGGDMVFGPDGKLYISTGDGANASLAQSKSSLLGKVLRMNPDGTVPDDNPFINDPTYTGINKLIYALGFRNPFSMDIQPGTGKIFACDVGNSNWEEINHVQAGKNYGWPLIEGYRTTETPPANYQDPFYAYSHADGCSIVGAAFYNPQTPQFPAGYVGKFFYADYCAGYIRQIDPAGGLPLPFATGINRPLAMAVDRTGALYYLQRAGFGGGSPGDNTSTPDGSLWKVEYTGSGEPFIGSHPQSTLVSVGEDAVFTVSVSGATPMIVQWQKDGVAIPGAEDLTYTFPSAQLTDNGSTFRCTITNAFGTVISNLATLQVTANTRPQPQILIPTAGILYRAGESILFSGLANDAEDGPIPALQLAWKIDFHHNDHTHPAMQPVSGVSSGTYEVPRIGETDYNVWYRIYLTATDSEGLSKTVYQDVHPELTAFIINTVPPGLTVYVDGQPKPAPQSVLSVIGVTRTLEAPVLQFAGADLFTFTQWSDPARERAFSFNAPADPVSFTAQFTQVPLGSGDGLRGQYFNQFRTFFLPADLTRIDPVINFDWGAGSPLTGTIQNNNFTARWEGFIQPPFTDTYTFYTLSDDGVRLWINHFLIIDRWVPQAATEWSSTMNLQAGELYPIKLEFFEDGGDAVMKLLWKSSLIPKQIIPQSQLYSAPITGIENPGTPGHGGNLNIYPTITTNQLTVQSGFQVPTRWTISTFTGQPVSSGIGQENFVIEQGIAGLSPGLYLFRMGNETKRFVKAR
ncbi:MAG: PQQ-dependent sugar dehydrogenase [Cyclobacteriaceae bacterium]|nr:PQQ-dependent sugar dehydrogenase [Cyclobacteriaceae bacterium]